MFMSGSSRQVSFSERMKAQGYEPGPKCCATTSLAAIAGIALFIIGCVGAAGAFPGSAIGWVTVGLAGGRFALQLAMGNFKQRKIDLIVSGLLAAVLVTVGTLGGMGVLSATQVGWGIIGTALAFVPLRCTTSCFKQYQIAQQSAQRRYTH